MASPRRNLRARDRELDREIERYRTAAASTLEHLEWTVGYLNRINKPSVARALDRNRRRILEGMRSSEVR
jgi:hypothetical protein